jgi:glycosyltransferase involved in cell wall biosynthesis
MGRAHVSVVIPVNDGERYLREAIDSVVAQQGVAVEVIVIDDGSNDASAAVAESYGPPVVCHSVRRSRGPGAARNLGVARATGEYLGFLDADDVWAPSKLFRQVAVMRAQPPSDLVFGAVRHFISPDLDAESAARLHCPEGTQHGYLAGALLTRRDVFERIGSFREDLRVGEVVDWLARAREAGLREVMLPEVVFERRLHRTNLGRRRREDRSDFIRLVKASLDRRRTALREAT